MLFTTITAVSFAFGALCISSLPTATVRNPGANILSPSSLITAAPELDYEWAEKLLKRSTTEIYSVSFSGSLPVCGYYASGGGPFGCADNELCAWNVDEGYYNGTLISMTCCGTLIDPGNGTAPYPDASNCLNLFDSEVYRSSPCLDYGLESTTQYYTNEGTTSSTVYDLSECSKEAPYCSGYSFAHLPASYAGYQCGTVKTTMILNVRTDLTTITQTTISVSTITIEYTVTTTPITPIRIGLVTSAPPASAPTSSSNDASLGKYDVSSSSVVAFLSFLIALLL